MDESTLIMLALGGILTLASGIGVAAFMQRMPPKRRSNADEEEVAEEDIVDEEPAPHSSSSSSPKKKKKRSTKASGAGEDDEALGKRPEIRMGTKCWHRQAKSWCIVVKVYYDDLPPYYSVRMPDGAERATVRSRLDTQEERQAELAAIERREAEQRAEAAAAALLAEEAKAERRKPTSEGKGSSGKSKKR